MASVLSRIDAVSEFAMKMRIELFYDEATPLEVSATFMEAGCSSNQSRWVFSRDLLIKGVSQAAGYDAVKITPIGGDIVFTITGVTEDNSNCSLSITCSIIDYIAFMTKTFDLVPVGSEEISIPDDISTLGVM